MRVSVVLLWVSLSCVQLQRGDDQRRVEDTQSGLNTLQNQSRVERSELNPNQTSIQPDVWTELRELRDMVVEQRVQLTSAQCQLQFSQGQIEELKKENTAMNKRLLATENQVEELKQLNAALEGRVVSTEVGVEALREENANRPKVAFSSASGLNGYLGPGVNTILVFSKEITNIGNAFSPITGVFTAPLRGVYYFRFNVFSNSASHWMCVHLFKNQEKILYVSERPDGVNEYISSGATLLLEKGDLVYIKLLAECQIFDNVDNHCNFSGFLLFPV
ncbi:cerebellin-3-like [Colossoma macropomum]|uniref:cerebellin-3-like n=1 Tax=Colossoma macropomum TaxID=42526 RepID=UPI001863F915|nr:cerebellin-3-like [Colossoma macropomum]